MPLLAPGVLHVATTKRDNAFLVDGDDGLTLVDVGWSSAPKTLLDVVAERRLKPTEVKRIVLTHAHPDHVQGAAELRRLTGAQVVIHRDDADWLPVGRVPAHGRSGALGRIIDRLPMLHWTPFTADRTVTDGELIDGSDGLRVIHTPGHSPGHIALHHEPSSTILVGDAVFHRGELALGPAALAADPSLRVESLTRVPADIQAIGFAHGAPLKHAGVDAFQQFLARLRQPPATTTS
ncbi:MBL fold metallo-hydrolase [Streptomyces sioyaensis]|uniref:MBL fold metallo-hydrolase n=1 Tax=Streptomyces sioyaensis TaxID=67364 RepID=UPI0037A06ECF